MQECCDKRNKVRASQTMVKWNNYAVSLLLLTCIAGGAWLLYAGKPIIDSLDSLTNTMVREVTHLTTCCSPGSPAKTVDITHGLEILHAHTLWQASCAIKMHCKCTVGVVLWKICLKSLRGSPGYASMHPVVFVTAC